MLVSSIPMKRKNHMWLGSWKFPTHLEWAPKFPLMIYMVLYAEYFASILEDLSKTFLFLDFIFLCWPVVISPNCYPCNNLNF